MVSNNIYVYTSVCCMYITLNIGYTTCSEPLCKCPFASFITFHVIVFCNSSLFIWISLSREKKTKIGGFKVKSARAKHKTMSHRIVIVFNRRNNRRLWTIVSAHLDYVFVSWCRFRETVKYTRSRPHIVVSTLWADLS